MKRNGRLAGIVAAVAVMAILAGPAGAQVPGALSKQNIDWVINYPQLVGSDIEFLERELPDGSLERYAIVGSMGNGFNIIDITDPAFPVPAGSYVSPGFNWQGDVQVNPRRNIVVLSTDQLGGTLSHGGGIGIELVDITDISQPSLLGVVSDVGGAHNSTIIDDRYIYTSLPTHIIDYEDPTNPINLGQVGSICGHDITLDPNRPDRAYSACSSGSRWQILDVSDPAEPTIIADVRDTQITTGHQADPAPDSSFVVVSDERGGGLSHSRCPGGGGHVYDISGKYVEGASEENPIKMGIYFAPWTGMNTGGGASGQWGNCTMHNFTFQAERFLMSVGWYSAGSFVADLSGPTAEEGLYQEYTGPDQTVPGSTTWGNTTGNILLEGAETWSTKWTRFDDPEFDRYLFTSDISRGFDTLHYTGPMPEKMARLTAGAEGGVVSGVLDRFAVWTHEGWVNKPLAGQELEVLVDGEAAGTATSAEDGSFSSDLGLEPGTYQVTVRWAGIEDEYQPAETSFQAEVA